MENQAQTSPANATVSDEIIVRDADGKFRVLRHGVLEDWTSGAGKHVPQERLPKRVHVAEAVLPKVPQPPVPAAVAAQAKTAAPAVARFYFDVKDEEEIERFRDKGSVQYRQALNDLAMRKAGDIIAHAGLAAPPDEEVKPRLMRAVVSRLKGVRDLIETKEVLLRARGLGGVNLDNADANKILRLTEVYRAQFEVFIHDVNLPQGQMAKEEPLPAVSVQQAPLTPPPVSAAPPAPAPRTLSIDLPYAPSAEARPFVHPSYQREGPNAESQKQKVEENESKTVSPSHTPPPPPAVPIARPLSIPPPSAFSLSPRFTGEAGQSSAVSGKPNLDDVKPAVRIMGPVDELRYMSLEDFRRLASQAADAADKIVEKVDLLADESLLKRGEGLNAWKSSPLYQMYIRIGKESMDKGAAVSRVIDGFEAKGMHTLTAQEFEAIADLNQKLAY